ncbi:phosphocarrier HPr, putative [Babesia ovata]|uniref:Phosphocarrier HPr, putative n=1 Tax=Babesia ovata TaxID=189622 RepID=A0A2H6KHE2_9APIC|nr:phosphocarrier HPr, putative [Babesia ovata]GBE62391.1 phosphocarrier HPr, putative [Babesia ovata]
MKQLVRAAPGFINRPCPPIYQSIHRDSLDILRNGDCVLSVVSAWKCVLRMFHIGCGREKELKVSLFDIVDSNDEADALKRMYEQFKPICSSCFTMCLWARKVVERYLQ